MKIVTVKIPEAIVEEIDRLVKSGRYTSRSEVIRRALELFLERNRLENDIVARLELEKLARIIPKLIEIYERETKTKSIPLDEDEDIEVVIVPPRR